jgi:hypothetical protein
MMSHRVWSYNSNSNITTVIRKAIKLCGRSLQLRTSWYNLAISEENVGQKPIEAFENDIYRMQQRNLTVLKCVMLATPENEMVVPM